MCVAAPLLHSLYRKIPVKLRIRTMLTVLVIFAADAAYSALIIGRGIAYY